MKWRESSLCVFELGRRPSKAVQHQFSIADCKLMGYLHCKTILREIPSIDLFFFNPYFFKKDLFGCFFGKLCLVFSIIKKNNKFLDDWSLLKMDDDRRH